MTPRQSYQYAPYSTCPNCGWSGKDWGFKYHSFCTGCYKRWRKEKAEEERKYKLPNSNVEIADGIVVTEHVHNRLRLRAERTLRGTPFYILARLVPLIIAFTTIGLMLNMDSDSGGILAVVMFGGFFLAVLGFNIFQCPWERQVKIKITELAKLRKQDIDEQQRFYNSAEWRLVREQVIQEQGRVCQNCGRKILNDYYLTVDHIKPRSKFPELALDKSNLQILCRKCNSAKGATYDESSITIDLGLPTKSNAV